MAEKVLIIDDDHAVCSSLMLLLKRKGYETLSVQRPVLVMDTMADFSPDLVLLDMNFTIETSGKQGLTLLRRMLGEYKNLPVILMTGWATVQLAVEGMKIGAKDFIAKPWDNKQLVQSINDILSLTGQQSIHVSRLIESAPFGSIVGQSKALKEVVDMAKRVAQTDASVLITGESGTGKELIAEAIHEMSKRKDEAFVKVNLGGLSTSLFESEMFGHKKGAFTGAIMDRVGRFEKADKGTIFLDEIGELPLESQVKMLRVLQEKTYEQLGSSQVRRTDIRVISATNKDLQIMVNNHSFREDLFYRINLIQIHIPALRDRREDISLLVKTFLKSTCSSYNIDIPYIDDATMSWLEIQEYPGNIRQLKNSVERAVLLNMNKNVLVIKDFQMVETIDLHNTNVSLPHVGVVSLKDMEISMIEKALNYHNHSISKTANSLGITRSSLYRRLEKFNINHESQI